MKFNLINEESINALMDSFYERVRRNKELSEIFIPKVGNTNEEWSEHKEKIGRFWRSNLLGEAVYDGYPLKVHLELDPFPREYFSIWLELFERSLDDVYDNDGAKREILHRAQMIARRFQTMMYDFPHNH